MEFIRNFLGNESTFGRIMYRVGVIVIGNLLFVFCSIPVVTVGASLAGLHYLCLKARRDKYRGNVRIISSFFKGFRENFKQATIAWIIMLLLAVVLLLEISWCEQFKAPVAYFKYGLIGMLVMDAIAFMYYFPCLAAFKGSMKEQLSNAAFFAFSRPHYLIVVAVLHVVPLAATYVYLHFLPLSSFLWALCGFGLIAYLCNLLHLRQFTPFLTALDAAGDPIYDDQSDDELVTDDDEADESEEKTLAEMRKFGL